MGQPALKSTSSSNLLQVTVDTAKAQELMPLRGTVEKLRVQASGSILNLARPQSSDELWRQTRPELFPWNKISKLGKVQSKFENFATKTPALPKGVSVTHGTEASEKFELLISDLLLKRSGYLAGDWCSQVQLATLSSLTVITVENGLHIAESVFISNLVAGDNAQSTLLIINIPADSSLNVIDDWTGNEGFVLHRLEAFVGPRARLHLSSVQRLGNASNYLARHNIHLGKDATFESLYLNIGAQTSRVDLDLFLNEPGASGQLRGVTISDGKRHTDFHPTQHHLAPHCRSDLFTKGIAKESAHSVYYGYIRVSEGAQRTDAYQTNRNLVLSDKARADSIPNLEIKANDVRCSHGASVGHVNAEDMFYLMSRGLSRDASERLLVEGFIEDVLGQAKDAALHDWLYDLVIARLDAKAK